MSVVLSSSDLLLLRAAQRAMLSVPDTDASSPVAPPDGRLSEAASSEQGASGSAEAPSSWVDGVAAALRPLFGTDHVYYSEPVGRGQDGTLFTRHPLAGDDFATALQGFFTGFEDGFTRFEDRNTTMIRRLVRSAGVGAFHDAPLYDTRRHATSPLHQAVFRPMGIERKLALSVPLPVGEAMLVVGYDEAAAPGFEGRRHRLLELLLPAFEAGLRIRHHLQRQPFGLDVVAGGAPIPILFIDDEGRERYRNAAFRMLLKHLGQRRADPKRPDAVTPDRLLTTAHALSAHVADERARTSLKGHASPDVRLADEASRAETYSLGGFRLRASLGTTYQGTPGVLIFVETPLEEDVLRRGEDRRRRVLPAVGAVQERTDLTAREAEVALLVAEGHADQDVAERLGISVHTARRHAGSILKKLGLTSRAGVAVTLLRATA